MRKWLIAAFVTILALGGYQAGKASAYSGGLINGMTGKYTYTNGSTFNLTTLTDGDETTSQKINGGDAVWFYMPNKDYVNISSYRIKASTTTTVEFDANGASKVFSGTLVTDGQVHSFSTTYNQVSAIGLWGPSSTGVTIYEVDFFGTYVHNTPPNAPTDLVGHPGDRVVNLQWTTPSGGDAIAGYNVYRDGVKVNSSPIVANQYQVTGLTNASMYSFQVTALDASGNESAKSNSVDVFLPDLNAPAKPMGLIAALTGLNAELAWTANTEADLDGYNVYQDGSLIADHIDVTAYEVPNLKPKTTYKFTVSAVDTDGNVSERSDPASVTTPDVLAMNLVGNKDSIIVQILGGSAPFTVSWDGGSDTFSATSYKIPNLLEDTDYTVTVSDSNGDTVSKLVNTGHMSAFVPPVFDAPDSIFQQMVDNFGSAGTIAVVIIGGAVALGIICILGMWGWRLAKKWLAAAR